MNAQMSKRQFGNSYSVGCRCKVHSPECILDWCYPEVWVGGQRAHGMGLRNSRILRSNLLIKPAEANRSTSGRTTAITESVRCWQLFYSLPLYRLSPVRQMCNFHLLTRCFTALTCAMK